MLGSGAWDARESATTTTYIALAGLGRVDQAVLVVSAVAVDVGKEVLGPVGRAAHAIGHLD